MVPIESIEAVKGAQLPQSPPEPRYDPERAARRKVRVKKVPYSYDPMKEKTVFEFGGFVYICYAKKTRGRSMIRCLGMAEVEPEQKPVSPYDAGKILTKAEDDMGDGIKEPINDNIDPTLAAKTLQDKIDDDVMGAIIESPDVQKIIQEVIGDG